MPWQPLEDFDWKVAKACGGNITVPDMKVDLDGLLNKWNAASDAFLKGKDALADLLEKMESAVDAFKNAVKRLAANYQGADFNLDRKNKDEAKKLDTAHKMYATFFTQQLKALDDQDKLIDEIQKSLGEISKRSG